MLLEVELAVFDGRIDPECASCNCRDQGLVDCKRRLGPDRLVPSVQQEERDIFNMLALSLTSDCDLRFGGFRKLTGLACENESGRSRTAIYVSQPFELSHFILGFCFCGIDVEAVCPC